MKQKISERLLAFLASKKFFWGLLGFFVFESVWIAISARYPMAFDEEFHFGVIKLYAANDFSPFFASQPEHADTFGAIARDPSYLYHYLMSFPYRLMSFITDSQAAQVIALRFMNIAFVVGGLIAFRALFLRAKLSAALAHTALAIFILVPIVPLLAGQINYDNLLILTVPLTLLLVAKILEGLRKQKVYVAQMVLLAAALLLECLIKYPAIPIALAVGAYVLYRLVRAFWGQHMRFAKAVAASSKSLSRKTVLGLAALLVLSAGLFFQRYGVNVIKYHDPLPDCAAVLTVKQCMANGPWSRNHAYVAQKTDVDSNILSYANLWFHDMLLRSVFAVNGPFSDYTNHFPLWVPQATFEFLCLVSIVLVLLFAARIFAKHRELQLFMLVSCAYIGILFWNNYRSYLHTGEPVAINGRYLLLVLPLILAICALSFVYFLRKVRFEIVKSSLSVTIILLLLQGGGFVTFVLQSDEGWYWRNSRLVTTLNDAARSVLSPVVYEKPAERFLKYE